MGKIVCSNCGYKVKNNVKYCPECGTELNMSADTHVKKVDIMSNVKKIKKIYVIIPAVTLIIIIAIVLIVNNKYNTFIRNYKKGNTDAIQSNYDDFDDKDIDKVYGYLSQQAMKIKDAYVNEKISYEDAKDQLNKIGKSCKTGKALADYMNCTNEVEKLHNSKASFKMAEDFYAKKNYEKAIDNYKKVIEGDSNYSESQSKIEVLIPTIAQEYYDKAKDEYDKEDYSSALSDINSAIKYVDNSEYQDMKQKCVEANNKAIADKAEAERQRKLLDPGKEITTSRFNIEYIGADFASKILPEKTSGAYSYYNCPNDSIYIDMKFYVTNISDYSANIDFVKGFSASYGTKKYTTCTEYYCELGSSSMDNIFSSTNITPLKKIVYHVVLKLPYEAINTNDSITISFKIDGEEQLLEFR